MLVLILNNAQKKNAVLVMKMQLCGWLLPSMGGGGMEDITLELLKHLTGIVWHFLLVFSFKFSKAMSCVKGLCTLNNITPN